MKQEWLIRRRTVEQKDGQRRWDLAYQCLLSWERERGTLTQNNLEANHEGSHLRTGIDPETSGKPDD